jgi:hypothetical protein
MTDLEKLFATRIYLDGLPVLGIRECANQKSNTLVMFILIIIKSRKCYSASSRAILQDDIKTPESL